MQRPYLGFLASLLALTACSAHNTAPGAPAAPSAKVDKTRPPACGNQLFGLKSSVWENLEVPVCWENPTANDEQSRDWVRAAVADTWERHSALRFSGWGQCQDGVPGIHIRIADTGPHTKGLGNQLDGKPNGMVLNFTFENWSPRSRKRLEYYIKAIAVHEFGHALGFAHEQNRDDAPDCGEERQGTDGDIKITPYDLHSVMNYCNPKYSGDGQLSDQDIAGLKAWYGAANRPESRYDGVWRGKLTYSDNGCVADPVSITVRGSAVRGVLKAADGQVIETAASLDENSQFNGLEFRVTYPDRQNFVDIIGLRGALSGGVLTSTDCGCGQYSFSRE